MIKFDKVTKKFGPATALEDISFTVNPGEITFLTGPSGSGKTTLIRLILGELTPTSGKILINELNPSALKRNELLNLRRKIGVVFQDFKLLLDRTVGENIALALDVADQKGKDPQKEIPKVLKLVGLESKIDYFPSQLAGGELQRVCLARAVVAEPEIVIADEPTGNLDIDTAWQIVKLLQEINRSGKTVLIATHNFEIVNSLKSRVIEIKEGKLVRDEKKAKYKAD